MSAGAELFEGEQWLRESFAAGTALCDLIGGTAFPNIHSERSWSGSVPCLIIANADGDIIGPVSGTPDVVKATFSVRGIVQGQSYQGAADIMKQAHPLIHAQRGTVFDGTTPLLYVQCLRSRSFQYPEMLDGKEYRHLGAFYSLLLENA